MSLLGIVLGKGWEPVSFRQFEYADSEYNSSKDVFCRVNFLINKLK